MIFDVILSYVILIAYFFALIGGLFLLERLTRRSDRQRRTRQSEKDCPNHQLRR